MEELLIGSDSMADWIERFEECVDIHPTIIGEKTAANKPRQKKKVLVDTHLYHGDDRLP